MGNKINVKCELKYSVVMNLTASENSGACQNSNFMFHDQTLRNLFWITRYQIIAVITLKVIIAKYIAQKYNI